MFMKKSTGRNSDTVSRFVRSAVMRAVKSYGNKSTELKTVRLFKEFRIIGWRRHSKINGKPDFVFPKQKIACFIDGCFWHGCREHCRMPKGNNIYWSQKIAGNKARDRNVKRALTIKGWLVVRIWEHELKRRPTARIKRLRRLLLKPHEKRT
jgi:DNA mismatch endonuclease, patch repair protein